MSQQPQPLSALLAELKCRTAPLDIDESEQAAVLKFLQQESQARQSHRIQRLLRNSGIRKAQIRTFDDFDWSFNPAIPKQQLLSFRNSNWVENAHNLTLIGDSGLGKTHLARALCYDAITKGYPTCCIQAFDLISKIKKDPESKIKYYASAFDVLCIDEFGYLLYGKEETDALFQIISKRSEVSSTILTTNLLPRDWGKVISGSAATAILDRLSFHGAFIVFDGDTYRGKKKLKLD